MIAMSDLFRVSLRQVVRQRGFGVILSIALGITAFIVLAVLGREIRYKVGQDMVLNMFVENADTAAFLAKAADRLSEALLAKGFRLKPKFLVLPPPPQITPRRRRLTVPDRAVVRSTG